MYFTEQPLLSSLMVPLLFNNHNYLMTSDPLIPLQLMTLNPLIPLQCPTLILFYKKLSNHMALNFS